MTKEEGFMQPPLTLWGWPGDSDDKESTCNTRGLGSMPRLGRPPGGGNGSPLRVLAWRIPWTEEPGRLQSMRSHRTEAT